MGIEKITFKGKKKHKEEQTIAASWAIKKFTSQWLNRREWDKKERSKRKRDMRK